MTFICVRDLPRNLMALLSKMFFPAQGMSQLSDGQGFTMGTLLARVYTAALSPEDRRVVQTEALCPEGTLVFLPLN